MSPVGEISQTQCPREESLCLVRQHHRVARMAACYHAKDKNRTENRSEVQGFHIVSSVMRFSVTKTLGFIKQHPKFYPFGSLIL